MCLFLRAIIPKIILINTFRQLAKRTTGYYHTLLINEHFYKVANSNPTVGMTAVVALTIIIQH